ncbi:MAG: acyltransferase [Pseudomonadota bacterium]
MIIRYGAFGEHAREQNNFNIIRHIAALAVLVAHSWALAFEGGRTDPISAFLTELLNKPTVISGLAVKTFFIVSGYLVTRSMLEGANLKYYAASRALRIYPALLVNVTLVTFLMGPLVTNLDLVSYLVHEDTWDYFLNNLPMWNASYYLPGVFTDNPAGAGVNGSLWTLPAEIRCYLAVGVLFAVGFFRSRKVAVAGLILFMAADLYWPDAELLGGAATASVIRYFLMGATFYLLKDLIPANGTYALALLMGALLLPASPLQELLLSFAGCWTVLWIGAILPPIGHGVLPSLLAKTDLSYGIYIYAFPIQQLLINSGYSGEPIKLTILAASLTTICAYCSWRFVERPALNRKKTFHAS